MYFVDTDFSLGPIYSLSSPWKTLKFCSDISQSKIETHSLLTFLSGILALEVACGEFNTYSKMIRSYFIPKVLFPSFSLIHQDKFVKSKRDIYILQEFIFGQIIFLTSSGFSLLIYIDLSLNSVENSMHN